MVSEDFLMKPVKLLLTLLYNKARQEIITKELLDIAGGAEALV